MREVMHVVKRLLGIVVLPMLCACGSSGLPKGHEIASSTAPDGRSRAFVWAVQMPDLLGATNSQVYEVWIQMLGDDKPQQLIMKADRTEGLVVTWKDSRELQVCYGPSYITDFRNFFDYATQGSLHLYHVEIALKGATTLADCK
jgi:hypothetical protein